MEASIWKGCPGVSVDPEVVHGEAVFAGTRLQVENAIESVWAYEELDGLSEDQAIAETIKDFPTLPDAEALRTVLAFEASNQHLLVP